MITGKSLRNKLFEIQFVFLAEASQYFAPIRFKSLFITRSEGRPLVFYLVPELFYAIQLQAVGRQDVKLQPFALQRFESGLNVFCRVHRSFLKNYHHGFTNMLHQQTEKAYKQHRSHYLP